MRQKSLTLAALTLIALPGLGAVAQAQDGAVGEPITAERIAECAEDRRAEGCATLLVRVLVCEQAPDLAGCDEINAAVEEAELTAEDIEAEVEPRAEGELADDETADDDAELDETEEEDDEEAIEEEG